MFREARRDAGEQLAHIRVREGLQVDGCRAPDARPPAGPAFEELRTRLCQHEDGRFARPGEEVLDEVEQSLVGPLQVPEDEHHRRLASEAFEERAPGGKELFAALSRELVESEQAGQSGLDPATFGRFEWEAGENISKLGARRVGVIRFGDARATTHHLRECPVADPLAIRRRAALVPQDGLDNSVQVLLELPAEAALPDACLAHDGHEPRLPLACGGMELVLEQA